MKKRNRTLYVSTVISLGLVALLSSKQMAYDKNKITSVQTGPTGALYYKDGKLVKEQTEALSRLKFLYSTYLGQFLRFFAKQKAPSHVIGRWQDSSWSKSEIYPFIQRHNIDVTEFEKPVSQFTTFNDFFIRKLKPGARSIDDDSNSIVSPCDGKLLVIADITEGAEFFVKEKPFNLHKLFNNDELAKQYEHGTLMLFRLAPYDYHRYHCPVSGIASKPLRIAGKLESVNPIVYNYGIVPFTENERSLVMLNTEKFGQVAMVIIGAMFVGKIVHTFNPESAQQKGDELGYFAFGGSSIILLFKQGLITTRDDIAGHSVQGYETAVQMGEKIAIKV